MLRIFLLVFFCFQTISIANEINLEDPFYKLGWKNLQNSKTSIVTIPNTNATLEVLESEIYLDKKENIKNYLEYNKGIEVNIDDIDEVFIIVDKEKFYEVEISYSDVGYVSSDRFKNFTPKDIMNTMKQNKPESVSDVNWVLEPGLSEKKISTYGYRVDWKDGGIGYEYEGIVLGRLGYFDISYATSGDGNETKDYFDYYNSIIKGVSESIVFDDGFTYNDFVQDEPMNMYEPTEKTEVRMAYDNQAIYVSARLLDDSPEKMVELVKNNNIVIGLCSNKDSFLAKNSEYFIHTPIEKEACPLNLAPTASTTSMLVLGDALAVALFAEAVALEAAFVALVVALAASTSKDHLAESVLVVNGCDPDDVCATLHMKILFVFIVLKISRRADMDEFNKSLDISYINFLNFFLEW